MLNMSDLFRGLTDTIILGQLLEHDSYGYEINKSIQQATGGRYELKEATLYTAFRRLEQNGCISSYWGDEGSGARRVIDFLSREEELTRLILAQGTQGAQAGGPRVLIGRETKRAELANSSVVSCRYGINGRDAGAIAVIGPTRMDYSKMVASIEYLANAVGRMLTELLDQQG